MDQGRGAAAPEPAWDYQAAVKAAIRAAGEQRNVFVARLALRLARLGFATDVRFYIPPGTPIAALRSVVAELTQAAQDAPGDTIGTADGSGAAPEAERLTGSVRTLPASARGTCQQCRQEFRVNYHHAATHRFCSASCRSRHRRERSRPAFRGEPTHA
jgi:hypothetical protein